MASKNFSQKLKELRQNAGFSQKQVYEHFGIPQSTFSSWEVGKSEPSGEMLIKLCDFYKCDMMKEFSDTYEDSLTYTELEYIKKYRFISQHSPAGRETVDYIMNREYNVAKMMQSMPAANTSSIPARIISYYYKNASAGSGQLIIDNLPEKDIEIPDLPEYKNASYAIGVNGSSMEPTYHDGDILLVEATREIEIGEIGIFQIDGECYVKELGETELISLNKDYPNVPLNESAQTMGKVIGRL